MTASAEAVPLPAEAALPSRREVVAHRGPQHFLDLSLAIGAGCVTGLLPELRAALQAMISDINASGRQ